VRVLLIAANMERMNLPPLPLGPALVAAACRQAGHEAVLLNLMFSGDARSAVQDSVKQLQPEAIAISVRNIDDQNMGDSKFLLPPVHEIVQTCRSLSGAPIIVGGAGYSIFPESALRYLGADMGICGEGEAAFPALLSCLEKGKTLAEVPGLCLPGQQPTSRTFAQHLDDFPLPDPALWIPAGHDPAEFWVPVQSRRGCPLDCSYCSTAAIEGRGLRKRSPQSVAAWLEQLVRAGFSQFNFVDNVFNLPLPYAKDLCRHILERHLAIKFWCIIYPKWVDEELVELAARAGCSEISLGFESGSEQTLASLNKRYDAEDVRRVSNLFARSGIFRRGFLLLGGPGETRETVEQSLAFADSLNLDALKITMGVRVYPGTPLATRAVAEGMLKPDEDLLWPRFYLAPGLREWLPERIARYKAERSWVM
jgi:radical SAM superfamily enzyme YgiQ (UPF0313 family)